MEFKMKEHSFQAEFEYGTIDISGDAQYGFRPYQLLVSSVAVCSGGVMRKILDKMRIPYEDIRIKADVTRNPDEADRIERIALHFELKGIDIADERMEKVMALTRKNCAMYQSVKDSIDIQETFTIIK